MANTNKKAAKLAALQWYQRQVTKNDQEEPEIGVPRKIVLPPPRQAISLEAQPPRRLVNVAKRSDVNPHGVAEEASKSQHMKISTRKRSIEPVAVTAPPPGSPTKKHRAGKNGKENSRNRALLEAKKIIEGSRKSSSQTRGHNLIHKLAQGEIPKVEGTQSKATTHPGMNQTGTQPITIVKLQEKSGPPIGLPSSRRRVDAPTLNHPLQSSKDARPTTRTKLTSDPDPMIQPFESRGALRDHCASKNDLYKTIHRQALKSSSTSDDQDRKSPATTSIGSRSKVSVPQDSPKLFYLDARSDSTPRAGENKDSLLESMKPMRRDKKTSSLKSISQSIVFYVVALLGIWVAAHHGSLTKRARTVHISPEPFTTGVQCKHWERLIVGWSQLESCPARRRGDLYRLSDLAQGLGVERDEQVKSFLSSSCSSLKLIDDSDDGWLVGLRKV